MKKEESRELLLSVFGVTLLIIAIAGITYAIFHYTAFGEKENVIQSGAITMSYIESNENIISINNAMPISDQVGILQQEYFDFTLSSSISGIATISYEIWAKSIMVENPIEEDTIKIYLEKENSGSYQEVLSPTIFKEINQKGMLLYQGEFINTKNTTNTFIENYRFKMWIDESTKVEESSKSFRLKIDVYANA